MLPVNVGYKVEAEIRVFIGKECSAYHIGSQVGAADTDIYDTSNPLSSVTFPLTLTDLVCERFQLLKSCLDSGHVQS